MYHLSVERRAPPAELLGDLGPRVQVIDAARGQRHEAVEAVRVHEDFVNGFPLGGARHDLHFFGLGVPVCVFGGIKVDEI